MNQSRPPFYLITGLILGMILGVVYAWLFAPVDQINTSPQTLSPAFKDDYRALVSSAYIATGDLGRAVARLDLLGEDNLAIQLSMQAQRTLGIGGQDNIARALGILAGDLGDPVAASLNLPSVTPSETVLQSTEGILENIPIETIEPALTQVTITLGPGTSPATSTATRRPTATASQTATNTATPQPTATQGLPFEPTKLSLLCDPDFTVPMIQVFVSDAAGIPVAGVRALVTWEGGEDDFVTGLKPNFGLGYADFNMTPGVVYTLRLTDGGEPVTGLFASECETNSGDTFFGSWQINFTQS